MSNLTSQETLETLSSIQERISKLQHSHQLARRELSFLERRITLLDLRYQLLSASKLSPNTPTLYPLSGDASSRKSYCYDYSKRWINP